MRRSKMEIQLDILKVIARKGPLKLTHIMYKANVNCSILKEYVDFLIRQDLLEEKMMKKEKIFYAITEKGLKVLDYFRQLQIMLPFVEEDMSRIPAILY